MRHLLLLLLVPLGPLASTPALGGETVIPARAADEFLRISDVVYDDGTVTGVVTNEGEATLRNVRLRILCSWRWSDEKSPGDDDPSWGAEHVIEEIAPAAEVRFRHQGPPRPARDDGRFHVEISVAGLDRARVVPE